MFERPRGIAFYGRDGREQRFSVKPLNLFLI